MIFKADLHFELLLANQAITGEVYCAQLERLDQALREKESALVNRKGVILQNDNTQPHTARSTTEKLRHLEWKVLPQPACSPNIASSAYQLSRSSQNFLVGRQFSNEE